MMGIGVDEGAQMKAETFLPDDYRPAEDEPFMNDCQLEYSTTRRVLNLISRELHIGKVEFVEGGLF